MVWLKLARVVRVLGEPGWMAGLRSVSGHCLHSVFHVEETAAPWDMFSLWQIDIGIDLKIYVWFCSWLVAPETLAIYWLMEIRASFILIFGLSPWFSVQDLQRSLETPGHKESLLHASELTGVWGPLGNFRTGGCCQNDWGMITGLELSTLSTPWPWGKGEGWRLDYGNESISRAYVMKPA